jgi:hypothetical protein
LLCLCPCSLLPGASASPSASASTCE